MPIASPELSILMPVRDEAINIPIMLKMLAAAVETPHEVLIIYDYQEDNSVVAAKSIQSKYPNLQLVYNDLGRGVLNALIKGIQVAKGEFVLITCVDDIGALLAIDDMVCLLRQGCDFVSGTRYSHGGRRLAGSKLGTFLSTSANLIFSLCGSKLTDTTTGFKMFKRNRFTDLKLESKPVGWVVAFEIGIKAQLVGFKLGEVPILSIDRLYGGNSTFQPWPWFVEYSKWLFWGIRQLSKNGSAKSEVMVRIPQVTPRRFTSSLRKLF